MIKPIFAALATLIAVVGISSAAQAYDAWKPQGTASTGEEVYLNLDAIGQVPNSTRLLKHNLAQSGSVLISAANV